MLDLHTFVANSALLRLRAFWGAHLAKIWWEGAQKHFIGPGSKGFTLGPEEVGRAGKEIGKCGEDVGGD